MPINPAPWTDVYNKFGPPLRLKKESALFIGIVLLLAVFGFFSSIQEGKITAWVSSEQLQFVDINSMFNESADLALNITHINSLRASGTLEAGIARIYYKDANNSLFLVFDSEKMPRELDSTTNETLPLSFSDVCVDTCNLEMPAVDLLVVLRGENASLKLSNITYSAITPTGTITALPMSEINLINTTTINLSSYFTESAGHALTYSAAIPAGIRSVLFDDMLFLSERDTGAFNASVTASNGVVNATNYFSIFVGRENTTVNLNATTTNITNITNLPSANNSSVDVDDKVVAEFLKRKKVPVIVLLKMPASPQNSFSIQSTDKKALLDEKKTEVDAVQQDVINDLKTEEKNEKDKKDDANKTNEGNSNLITGAQVIDFGSTPTAIKQYDTINAIAIEITPAELELLKSNPNVTAIFYDMILNISLQDSIPLIRANDTHLLSTVANETITGHGQSVCIIDTGVDYTHPALVSKVVGGINFVANNANPADDSTVSHGTHVAGIVSAVAPDAKIVPVKICDSAGSCSASNILAGIDYCTNRSIELNISVISGSFGDGGQYDSATCPNWFDSALIIANNMGIINVFASGNNGFLNGVSYPSCSPYSISVGAADKLNNIASFSNRGARLDVLAPGVSINSTIRGGVYGILSGTSMATPFVSGTVALLKQVAKAQQQSLSLNSTVQTLKSTGVAVGSWSRINVLNAVLNLQINNTNLSNATSDLSNRFSTPPSAPEVDLEFNETVNKTRLGQCGRFANNFVEIDSFNCPELNRSARVTLHNVPFIENISILRNGAVCPPDVCSNLTLGQRVMLAATNPQVQGITSASFNVNSFSNYSLLGNAGNFSISGSVSTCGIVNNSGATLTANVVDTSGNGCFDFNESGGTLDCAGFNITSNPQARIGINVSNYLQGAALRVIGNITIKNCNIFNFSVGINISSAINVSLVSNNVSNSTDGILFNNSKNIFSSLFQDNFVSTVINNGLQLTGFNSSLNLTGNNTILGLVVINSSVIISPLANQIIATNILFQSNGSFVAKDSNAVNSQKNGFIINLTGNLIINSGGFINLSGAPGSSTSGQRGGNLTVYASRLQNDGEIVTAGGSTGASSCGNGDGLSGGNLTFFVNYLNGTGNISSRAGSNSVAGNSNVGGAIIINASDVNYSGLIDARGGQGGPACTLTFCGHRGAGGGVNITAQNILFTGIINATRGDSGGCNDSVDGDVYFTYNNTLNLSGSTLTPAVFVPDSKNCSITDNNGAGHNCSLIDGLNTVGCVLTNIRCNVRGNLQAVNLTLNNSYLYAVQGVTLNVTNLLNISQVSLLAAPFNANIFGNSSMNLSLNNTEIFSPNSAMRNITILNASNNIQIFNPGVIDFMGRLQTQENITNNGTIKMGVNREQIIAKNLWVQSNGIITANDSDTLNTFRAHLIINLSGNLTLNTGSSINLNGTNSISSFSNAQSGGNLTVYAVSFQNDGMITADGGSTNNGACLGVTSGFGGNLSFFVNYLNGTGSITSRSGSANATDNGGNSRNGGTIFINASDVNSSGAMDVRAGPGGATCSVGSCGARGAGGRINITAQNILFTGMLNATRSDAGACNGTVDGDVYFTYTNILNLSGSTLTPAVFVPDSKNCSITDNSGPGNNCSLTAGLNTVGCVLTNIRCNVRGNLQAVNLTLNNSYLYAVQGVTLNITNLLNISQVSLFTYPFNANIFGNSSMNLSLNNTEIFSLHSGMRNITIVNASNNFKIFNPGVIDFMGRLQTQENITNNGTIRIGVNQEQIIAKNLLVQGNGAVIVNDSSVAGSQRISTTINLSGNLTLNKGGLINWSGINNPNFGLGSHGQSGGNLTVYANQMQVDGIISADGGSVTSSANGDFVGSGGNVSFFVNYFNGTGNISSRAGYGTNSYGGAMKSSGTLSINATDVNFSGVIDTRGGNGGTFGCSSGLYGDKGSGGFVNITAQNILFTGILNSTRGDSGYCDNGRDGDVYFTYTNTLNLSGSTLTPAIFVPDSKNCAYTDNSGRNCSSIVDGVNCNLINIRCNLNGNFRYANLTLNNSYIYAKQNSNLNVTQLFNVTNKISFFTVPSGSNIVGNNSMNLSVNITEIFGAISGITIINATNNITIFSTGVIHNDGGGIITTAEDILVYGGVIMNHINNGNYTAKNIILSVGGKLFSNDSGAFDTQRVGFIINVSNNLIIRQNGSINADGMNSTSFLATYIQKGGNITIFTNLLQLDGNISSTGGANIVGGTDGVITGAGGNITIFANYVNGTGMINVSGGEVPGGRSHPGGNAGTLVINASDVNFTGSLFAIGGGSSGGITQCAFGTRGSGGLINISAKNIFLGGTINASRSNRGTCGTGDGGKILLNASTYLNLNGSVIDVQGNTTGIITLQSDSININNSKISLSSNKTGEAVANNSLRIIYNTSIWANSSNWIILPLITKDTGVGKIQSLKGMNLSAEDNPNDLIRISSNNITIDTANARSLGAPTGINVSANITLFNIISATRPIVQVDYSGSGTSFAACVAPKCVNLSFANNIFTFNVSSFTTYKTVTGLIGENTTFFCDQGDLVTTCNVTTRKIIADQNFNLAMNNLIINTTGSIVANDSANSDGQRIGFIINLTGNLTIVQGGLINLTGSEVGFTQRGGNFSIYGGVFQLYGNITSNGGDFITNNNPGGAGGSIRIFVNQFNGTGNIISQGGNGDTLAAAGGNGGTIIINSTDTNFSGSFSVIGGRGTAAGCAPTRYAGSGGSINLTSPNTVFKGTINASRGTGICNHGSGGTILFNATNYLSLNSSAIYINGNESAGLITLQSDKINLNNTIIALQANSSVELATNKSLKVVYNTSIWANSSALFPLPVITKDIGIVSVDLFNINLSAEDEPNSLLRVTGNNVTIDTANAKVPANLNVSANLTFYQQTTSALISIIKDTSGAGSFEDCNSPECIVLSTQGTTPYKFNVSHFTTYNTRLSCGDVNIDNALTADFTATRNTSCFNINTSNILFNCNSHKIIGQGSGIAFNITSVSNSTIANCDIINFTTAVNITRSQNITINNTNMSNSSYGVFANATNNLAIINLTTSSINIFDLWINKSNITIADMRTISNFSFNETKLTLLKTRQTQIKFLSSINANGSHLSSYVSLSTNLSRINSTIVQGFNASANITLFDISGFSNPQVIVSYADNSSFENCNSTKCRELSFDGNGYIFNVSSFTTYSINETPPITLLNPMNNSWINSSANINFDWTDSFSTVAYVFNLSNQSDFGAGAQNLSRISVADSNYTNSSLILSQNITYYWFVTAFDSVNNVTNSTISSFKIDSFAPNTTLLGNMPADNTFGSDNVLFNWTVSDNLNATMTCYPTSEQNGIKTLLTTYVTQTNNGTNSSVIAIVPGGIQNLTVTCFDNANANVSSTKVTNYIAAGINITTPFNSTIVRPFDNITINVSETFGKTFLDQVNITVDAQNVTMIDLGNNNWTATFVILNQTPRYLNITALGYNKATGTSANVTQTIQLRLDRPVGQAANVTLVTGCSNQTYVMNNTNVTVTTAYHTDTLPDSVNLSVTLPSGIVLNLTPTVQTFDVASSIVTSNFSFNTTANGQHNFTGVVSTIANQTFNQTFTFFNRGTNFTLNISGLNISRVIVRDYCSGIVLNNSLDKLSFLLPNDSIENIEVDFGDPISLNFTPAILNNTILDGTILINVSTDYTKRTNETPPPEGMRRIMVWDNNITNMNYGNITLINDYSSIAFTISSEANLQLYRCQNITNCNLTKVPITRDVTAHKAFANFGVNNLSKERFLLVEPAVTNPDALRNPTILAFNLSKKYLTLGETINITVEFNMSLSLDNVTFNINGDRLSPLNITTINPTKHFIYRYNYTPSSLGVYTVYVNITDDNTFMTNATKVFFVNTTKSFTISAPGTDSVILKDSESNISLASATPPPITTSVPPGYYNSKLTNATLNLTLFFNNFTLFNSPSTVLSVSKFESENLMLPKNQTYYDAFTINTSNTFNSITLVYNYSWLVNQTVRQRNLQILECHDANLSLVPLTTPSQYNCTDWIDTLPVVDLNGTTLELTLNNLSTFLVTEAYITQTNTVTRTTAGAGGGGGGVSQQKTVAALSFVTPKQPLIMYNKDEMTALFVVKNTGKTTLNDVKLDAYTDTKDLSLRLEKTSIPSLAVGEEVMVKLFITSHTDPAAYEITVTATAANVPLVQSSKIYITLQRPQEVVVTEQMLTEMRVANDILQKNPKCIELKEFLIQSETALKEGKYEKARSLASAAIEGCQELIAYSAELEKPAPLIDLEKLKNYLIIGLAFISAILLILGYLIGVLGKHQHAGEEIRRKQFTPARRVIGAGSARNLAVSRLAGILKKKKSVPLPIQQMPVEKTRKGFISKLTKKPGAPFYMPQAKGRAF